MLNLNSINYSLFVIYLLKMNIRREKSSDKGKGSYVKRSSKILVKNRETEIRNRGSD
jgi:hypothetical protein